VTESMTPNPEPMTDEMLAMVRRTWDGVDSSASRVTVTNTKTPGQLVHALSCAPRDVRRLLAEVERLRADLTAMVRTGEKQNRHAADTERARHEATQHAQMAEAKLDQVLTAITYLQGPEECLERECEEYFDADGEERPGVEYCSHLKAKRLDVDEHLAVLAERDRLSEQVKHVREVIGGARGREKQLLEWAKDIKGGERRTGGQAVALEARTIADRLERALDGTEAGS
jgi:hypothetical protein